MGFAHRGMYDGSLHFGKSSLELTAEGGMTVFCGLAGKLLQGSSSRVWSCFFGDRALESSWTGSVFAKATPAGLLKSSDSMLILWDPTWTERWDGG